MPALDALDDFVEVLASELGEFEEVFHDLHLVDVLCPFLKNIRQQPLLRVEEPLRRLL